MAEPENGYTLEASATDDGVRTEVIELETSAKSTINVPLDAVRVADLRRRPQDV